MVLKCWDVLVGLLGTQVVNSSVNANVNKPISQAWPRPWKFPVGARVITTVSPFITNVSQGVCPTLTSQDTPKNRTHSFRHFPLARAKVCRQSDVRRLATA